MLDVFGSDRLHQVSSVSLGRGEGGNSWFVVGPENVEVWKGNVDVEVALTLGYD